MDNPAILGSFVASQTASRRKRGPVALRPCLSAGLPLSIHYVTKILLPLGPIKAAVFGPALARTDRKPISCLSKHLRRLIKKGSRSDTRWLQHSSAQAVHHLAICKTQSIGTANLKRVFRTRAFELQDVEGSGNNRLSLHGSGVTGQLPASAVPFGLTDA